MRPRLVQQLGHGQVPRLLPEAGMTRDRVLGRLAQASPHFAEGPHDRPEQEAQLSFTDERRLADGTNGSELKPVRTGAGTSFGQRKLRGRLAG